MPQEKEQGKTPEKNPNEMEISNVLDKEFKEMVIRMLNKLKNTVEGLREHFNEEIENVKKNQSEMKNIIAEMENTLEGINNRLVNTEERISYLEDRIMEIAQSEQQNKKRISKNEDSIRDLWDNIKCPTICIIVIPEGEEREKDRGRKNI